MHAGEEIKVAQPRQNKKKKLKGRIYQKLKKAKDDEGDVGDVMDDIAEAKVIQIAQEGKQSINHTRFLILRQVTCVLILTTLCVHILLSMYPPTLSGDPNRARSEFGDTTFGEPLGECSGRGGRGVCNLHAYACTPALTRLLLHAYAYAYTPTLTRLLLDLHAYRGVNAQGEVVEVCVCVCVCVCVHSRLKLLVYEALNLRAHTLVA